MTLEGVLVIAAALFAVGLYGALSQQVVVMVMMGLELMINGVLLAAAGFWWFLAPDPSGQVLLLVTICVGGLQTIPSRGVWADDTGRCVSDRRSFVRGGSLRGLVSAGCRHGDDGTGADDQWGVVGCRRVLVVPGPGPVWPGSAAGDDLRRRPADDPQPGGVGR